ncbi:MAG TPA: acyl-ACP thioesterase [Clostridiaceae bacterium]|nr:acyl-ACP thioesterase [Clostridiaceae bacterium]
MEPLSKLSKNYQVTVSDCDFTKKLKLSSLFNYFQEIAALHADNLGIGISTLEYNYGVIWALIRIRTDIIRHPGLNEEILIETWPQYPKKYEFHRDFLIRDAQDNIIVRAASVWVLLDKKTRELKKSELITGNYPPLFTERAIDSPLRKIRPEGKPEISYKRVIGCSDIDVNGHLNNSKYIDFIMDCFSMKDIQRYQVRSLQVNYLNEALAGDTITLLKDSSSLDKGIIYIEGLNEQDDKVIFNAEINVAAI